MRASKIAVLGAGSLSGVDTARFRADPEARVRVRAELGVDAQSPLLLYVGRIKREKGIAELLQAFRRLRSAFPAAHLLFVGPDEDRLFEQSGSIDDPQIHIVGYTNHVEQYMAAADLLCLPSHREGFGSVIIEAAACGVPAVASRIYGLTDAIVDGETGLLHPVGDSEALRRSIARLLADPPLRARMADSARRRVQRDFGVEAITGAWVDYYLQHAPAVRAPPS